MSRLFVKICGMTRAEDLRDAIDLGADAVGFIAYEKSPRFISPENVAKICLLLGGREFRKAGVFVNAEIGTIEKYVDAGVNVVQLHGDESPEFVDQIPEGIEIWKAIRPRTVHEITAAAEFPADKFLIDTFSEKARGGTGLEFNPDLAKFAVETLKKPLILAGGLAPWNVVHAVESVRPFGIDVNSGVESSPGIKDKALLEELFRRIAQV